MVGCSILGCKSRSERKIEGITFHSFPASDDTLKTLWVDVTGRQNWQPTKYSKICSIHFDVNSFEYKKKNVILKPNSAPVKHIFSKNPTQCGRDEGAKSFHDAVSVMPCTSTSHDHVQMSGTKRTNVLQEVQNIQNKRQHLMSQPVLEQSSTPIKHKSIQKLFEIEKKKSASRLKKLRAVRERKRRLEKKSARLENIIAALKCKMLASSEDIDLLSNIDTTNADFLKRYLDNENSPRKYSASLRKFTICLHFISPKAYMFIRKQFNTCLPHPKTLYKWYTCIDCDPGFTREAFDALKLLVKKSTNKILCSVSLDEMSIRQHLQWNGKQTVGYVNIGQHLDADNVPLAKDVLVFMVTSLNGSWKIPVGYFLTNGVNGEQRSTLLQNCVHLLKE